MHQILELEHQAPEVGLEEALLDLQLLTRLLQKGAALAGAVELERIDKEGLSARDEDVEAQGLIARRLREATHAPPAIAEGHPDLLAPPLDLELRRRWRGLGRRSGSD